jgi:hypothetical protein
MKKSWKIQENALDVTADPAASRTCLFPSPFLRESGGDGDSLPTACNFGVRYAFSALLDTFPLKKLTKAQVDTLGRPIVSLLKNH